MGVDRGAALCWFRLSKQAVGVWQLVPMREWRQSWRGLGERKPSYCVGPFVAKTRAAPVLFDTSYLISFSFYHFFLLLLAISAAGSDMLRLLEH